MIAYAGLASIAVAHNEFGDAKSYLDAACEYVIGYGYHKDLTLHHALDVVDSQFRISPPDALKSLELIAPAIAEVMSFTDGDETSHLAEKLGAILASRTPARLPAYYFSFLQREEYLPAQDVLHHWLRQTEFANHIEVAIGCTAVDENSLHILQSRAAEGNIGAGRVLEVTSALLSIPTSPVEDHKQSHTNRGERAPDPMDYPPEQFGAFAAAARLAPRSTDSTVEDWIDIWTKRSGSSNILTILDREDPDAMLGDPDRRFRLALETLGATEAYRYLVRAQSRFGWDSFSSDHAHGERWAYIRDLYPSRWFDFVIDSVQRQRGFIDNRSELVVGAPRLVEYLSAVGREDDALEVGRAFIQSVSETLSPFDLQPAGWIARDAGLLDLLLSRLQWPSGLVRERAATIIAENLLAPESDGLKVALLEYLRSQDLESLLIPPLLAVYRATTTYGREVYSPAELLASVRHASLISNILIRATCGDTAVTSNVFDMHSGTAPVNHEHSSAFLKNRSILPGVFTAVARHIEDRTPLRFEL